MTYAGLALAVVAGSVALAVVAALVRRLDRRWWLTTALTAVVLTVLTVVFDSLMIAADLFRYGDEALLGVHLWLAPVEDVAWALAAAFALPALWALASPATGAPTRPRTEEDA